MEKHEFSSKLRDLMYPRETQQHFGDRVGLNRNTIGQYLSNTNDKPASVDVIKQICEKCHVSADWLLGLSDVKTPDTSIQAICKYTGLSEKSIKYLSDTEKQDWHAAYVNTFLEDKAGQEIIADIVTFLNTDFAAFWNLGPRGAATSSEVEVMSYNGMVTLGKEEMENAYILRIINKIQEWKRLEGQ